MNAWLLNRGPVYRRRFLAAFVALFPLIIWTGVRDPIDVPKLSVLIICVSAVMALRVIEIIQGQKVEGLQLLVVPAAALAIPLLIAWTFSSYKGWSLLGQYARLQGLIPYLIVILFGILVADAFAGRGRELLWAFVLSGSLVGLYALAQVVGIDPIGWSYPPDYASKAVTTLGNPNFTGGYLGLVLPAAVGLLLVEEDRRSVAATLLLVVVGGWIVARSQGGWAAGVAGSAVVLGVYLSARWNVARRVGYAAAIAAISLALGSVLFAVINPESRAVAGTIRLRGFAWRAATGMFADSPIIGSGPNSFALEGVQHRHLIDALRFNYNFPDDPHSVFLALLAGAGVLGGVGFLTLLVWAVRKGVTARDASGIVAAAFFGSVIAYFAQALVSIDELTLRVGFWTALAGLSAALLPQAVAKVSHRKARGRKKAAPQGLRNPALVGLVAVLACVPLVYAAMLVNGDGQAKEASQLFAQGLIQEGHDKMDSAISKWDNNTYSHDLGFELGQAALAAGSQGRPLLEEARDAYSFTRTLPDVFSIVDYASLLHSWSQIDPETEDEALSLFQRARELDPLNPLIAVELAGVLIGMERDDEALEVLLRFEPVIADRYPEYWGTLAAAAVNVGDEEIARDAIETALELDPEQERALDARDLLEERG